MGVKGIYLAENGDGGLGDSEFFIEYISAGISQTESRQVEKRPGQRSRNWTRGGDFPGLPELDRVQLSQERLRLAIRLREMVAMGVKGMRKEEGKEGPPNAESAKESRGFGTDRAGSRIVSL